MSVTPILPPVLDENGKEIESPGIGEMSVDPQFANAYVLFCCGKISMSKWLSYGDDFHLTDKDLTSYTFPFNKLTQEDLTIIEKVAISYRNELPSTLQFKLNAGQKVGTFNTRKLWHLTDITDMIFLKYLTDDPHGVFQLLENHLSVSVITDKGCFPTENEEE